MRAAEQPIDLGVEPALWHRAPAPALQVRPDLRELAVWLYTKFDAEPVARTIRVHASGAAEIIERPVHEVVDVGDQIARATAALVGTDAAEINWALFVLARAHVTSAAPSVAKILGSDNANLRSAAASTLAELGEVTAVDALAAAARRETEATAQTAEVQALGTIPTKASIHALAELRSAIKGAARIEVVHALGKIGAASPSNEVRAALADAATHDVDKTVRTLAKSYLDNLH